jgi:hypothetical protein
VRLVFATLSFYFLACSPGTMVSDDSNDQNKNGVEGEKIAGDTNASGSNKKPVTTESPNDDSSASEPQVVTGAYLGCVQDVNAKAAGGDAAIGCGVYDKKSDEKRNLGTSSLSITARNLCSNAVSTDSIQMPETSPFHVVAIISGNDCRSFQIRGDIKSSSGKVLHTFNQRTIRLKTLKDGLDLKKNYTKDEISAWCGLTTSLRHDPNNWERVLAKGTACGADYLACKSGSMQPVAQMISEFLSLPGMTNTGANAGVCEQPGVTTNQSTSVKRCACRPQ